MSLEIKIEDVSVNDYLVACDKIPIFQRNRDWTPVFSGFSFELADTFSKPSIDDTVEFYIDSDIKYFGTISEIIRNYERKTWEITCEHYLMKLKNHKVEFDVLNPKFIEEATTGVSGIFTVDTAHNSIVDATHGLNTGDYVSCNSTGTLPVGIVADKIYQIHKNTADEFQLVPFPNKFLWGSKIPILSMSRATECVVTCNQKHGFFQDDKCKFENCLGMPQFNGNVYSVHRVDDYVFKPKDADGNFINTSAWGIYYGMGTAQLFTPYDETYLRPPACIDINDSGTGFHTWNQISPALGYNFYLTDSVDAIFPCVRLDVLITKVFDLIDVELDTTEVDDLIIFGYQLDGDSQRWRKWDEVVIDENMLYCLNQDVATFHTTIDDKTKDYYKNKINCLDLITELFGLLGFALVVDSISPTVTYKLYHCARRTSGSGGLSQLNEPYPTEETIFSIDDDDKFSFSERTIIPNKEGCYVSRSFDWSYDGVYDAKPFRQSYVDVAEEETHTFDYLTQYGENELQFFSNLAFFPIDVENQGVLNYMLVLENVDLCRIKDGYEGYNTVGSNWFLNKFYSEYMEWIEQEITCPIQSSFYPVKEISIDVENQTTTIVQETTELTLRS